MVFSPLRADTGDRVLRSKFNALFSAGLRLADLTVLVSGGVVAYWLMQRFGPLPAGPLPNDVLREISRAFLLGILVLNGSSLYRSWRGRGLFNEIAVLTAVWTGLFALTVLYGVLLKMIATPSRAWWLTWFALSGAGAIGMRIVIRRSAEWVRASGVDHRSAIIVGGGPDAERIAASFRQQPWIGVDVIGRFGTPLHQGPVDGLAKLGELEDIAAYVQQHQVDQVWLAVPLSARETITTVLDALRHSTADIKYVPDLFGLQLLNHSVEQVAGMPVISLRSNPLDGNAHLVKALEDRLLSVVILVLIAPLLLLIAIGVKLDSPGPVLFRQRRHGMGGREIVVWKFRSMRQHDAQGTVAQATRDDARITRFGRFLRRSSLDELPQFFNVLQGRMSIVGPRPHAVEHNTHYMDQVEAYMQRHRVKPGITGWAQVNGLRGETDTLDKMKRRIEHDLFYMQHWSLWFDLRIILMTPIRALRDSNAY